MIPLHARGAGFERLGRYVYVLHYLIDGDDQVIVRIWHGRENRI